MIKALGSFYNTTVNNMSHVSCKDHEISDNSSSRFLHQSNVHHLMPLSHPQEG